MTSKRLLLVAALAVVLCLPAFARADQSDSAVLNAFNALLSTPKRQIAVAVDGTLLIKSEALEASVGTDGKVRVHKAGTVARFASLHAELARTEIGHLLGHRGTAQKELPAALAQLLKDQRSVSFLRRDSIGFNAKRYDNKSRPLDLRGNGLKASVKPDGRVKLYPKPGAFGFQQPATTPTRVSARPKARTRTRTKARR